MTAQQFGIDCLVFLIGAAAGLAVALLFSKGILAELGRIHAKVDQLLARVGGDVRAAGQGISQVSQDMQQTAKKL